MTDFGGDGFPGGYGPVRDPNVAGGFSIPVESIPVEFGEINVTVSNHTTIGTRWVGVPFCPDLLRWELLGEADRWRGRVVRGFFWLMRWWPDA